MLSPSANRSPFDRLRVNGGKLYTATLITAKAVVSGYRVNSSRNPDAVPAKAGNHYFRSTGFPRNKYKAGLVMPGMTNHIWVGFSEEYV